MRRQFDNILLGSIELFCLAAEAGSFTAAALAAGVTPAAVSRSVGRLEERLGVRLFVRTTRSIRLTDGGQSYYAQCRQGLSQLVEAEREVMGKQQDVAGRLKISIPTTYGHHRVLPVLAEFAQRHPKVQVDIHLSNRNIDFIDEGYDMAIRVRAQPDSSMIARHLEDAALVVVAAPEYLARQAAPNNLDDLQQHNCIQFELPSSGRQIAWLFKHAGKELEVSVSGNCSCSGDVLGGVTLAKHGAGLFQAYRFTIERELAEGSLIEVLKPYSGRSRPFSLLYPHARHVPLRLRVFIDFLLEKQRSWAAAG